ncbi:L,D-transpeptidase [Psychrobacter lutiphocae]|uniref:L,D-transpeptidase n=1 Tax=Psychrobacter lutiphocae TaxID=540500 RepID=UPI000687B660|nr:L,D-transpeptidase [Psychrobacter lutiphocae]
MDQNNPSHIQQYSEVIRNFDISTAKNGIGSQEGSYCTPLGKHSIAAKIGTDLPINSVFVAREPTGEIYSEQLGQQYPDRDWILTRILRLQGCEEGVNKGHNELGCCDSYQRYIYIHGTPDTEPMGVPLSHGCVRMRNTDLIWLYEQVEQGTPVYITAS